MLDGPDHLLGYRAATSSVGGGKLWGQKFDLLAAEHVMLGVTWFQICQKLTYTVRQELPPSEVMAWK